MITRFSQRSPRASTQYSRVFIAMSEHALSVSAYWGPAKAGIQRTPVSLPRTQPVSSPRRRGPITTKVSVVAGTCHIALLRRMGPRLRGDDGRESLLHIFLRGATDHRDGVNNHVFT